MNIRWFRAVMSVILTLALLSSVTVGVAPPAMAQPPQVITGPFQGNFGTPPSMGSYEQMPPPQYQVTPPAPSPLPAPISDRGRPATPGMCTSQTYQTLAIPRGLEVRQVATQTTMIPGTTPEKETQRAIETMMRPDMDGLSPIEAAFQMAAGHGVGLAQSVFEPPPYAMKPPTQDVLPYVPVTAPVPTTTPRRYPFEKVRTVSNCR